MAVYQGARRPGGFALPWVRPEAPARDRGAARPSIRPAARAGARAGAHAGSTVVGLRRVGGQRRVSLALAGIVVTFSVAFVSLSQSVQVAATSYDIVRLQSEHDRLVALQQELQSDVQRLRGEPAIRKEALDAGLGQLGAPVLIPAR